MKNKLGMLIGLLVGLFLLAYMVAFQVRFDQVAVVTTFDQTQRILTEPGLYYRLPWPIQKVQYYPVHTQLHETRLEQTQTLDNKSLVVKAYVNWRIQDPAAFFVNLQTLQAANEKLAPLLSSQLSGTIGRFRVDQLVNTDRQQIQLDQIEAQALAGLRQQLQQLNYGIEAQHVGIRRLLLPQESTEKVFETMRMTRQRLASNARSTGNALAATIKSEADAVKRRILAFAERRAQAIRALGDQEAAQYYGVFRQDESLAVFLRRIETLKAILPHNTTFVLDADRLSLENGSPLDAAESLISPDPHLARERSSDPPSPNAPSLNPPATQPNAPAPTPSEGTSSPSKTGPDAHP